MFCWFLECSYVHSYGERKELKTLKATVVAKDEAGARAILEREDSRMGINKITKGLAVPGEVSEDD